MTSFTISIDIGAPPDRVWLGFIGNLLARMTRGITERYLDLEARGLKARSENPAFRHDQ